MVHAHGLADDIIAGFVLAATAATSAQAGRSDIAKRDVRASLDVGDGGARDQLERRVVVDLAVLEHAAVPMRGVLAEAHVREQEELRDCLTRYHQVQQMLIAEQTRLLQALGRHGRQALRKQIKRHIAFLERELHELDADLDDQLKQSPLWREQDDLLQSVPGIGSKTARTMLAFLPELGTATAGEIAKLAGLAPIDSMRIH